MSSVSSKAPEASLESAKSQYSHIKFSPLQAVFFTVAAYIAGQVGGALWYILSAVITGQEIDDSFLEGDIDRTLLVTLIGGVSIYAARAILKWRGNSLKDIGLKKPKLSQTGLVLINFGAYFATTLLAMALVTTLIPGLDTEQEQQIGFTAADDIALLFVALVIVAPVVEEILTRGVLFSGLRTGLSFWPATIVTSIVFALAHLPAAENGYHWPAAIDTFVLSIFLCNLREKTNGLFAPILLHALKNSVALFFLTQTLQ